MSAYQEIYNGTASASTLLDSYNNFINKHATVDEHGVIVRIRRGVHSLSIGNTTVVEGEDDLVVVDSFVERRFINQGRSVPHLLVMVRSNDKDKPLPLREVTLDQLTFLI